MGWIRGARIAIDTFSTRHLLAMSAAMCPATTIWMIMVAGRRRRIMGLSGFQTPWPPAGSRTRQDIGPTLRHGAIRGVMTLPGVMLPFTTAAGWFGMADGAGCPGPPPYVRSTLPHLLRLLGAALAFRWAWASAEAMRPRGFPSVSLSRSCPGIAARRGLFARS